MLQSLINNVAHQSAPILPTSFGSQLPNSFTEQSPGAPDYTSLNAPTCPGYAPSTQALAARAAVHHGTWSLLVAGSKGRSYSSET